MTCNEASRRSPSPSSSESDSADTRALIGKSPVCLVLLLQFYFSDALFADTHIWIHRG
jgi:hypothetical protein